MSKKPHPFDGVDLRAEPQRYTIGRGEYGVFHAEPYKSELLPLWHFRTPEVAREATAAIFARYEDYRDVDDFVGMDVARKYMQMGYTRARRYANHRNGIKYNAVGEVRPLDHDAEKAESAAIFADYLGLIMDDPVYRQLKIAFQKRT